MLVSGLAQVSAIRAGGTHSLARLHSGAVYAWGGGSQGQLGLGGTSNVSTPTLVTGLTTLDLEAGDLHSLGINTDGSMATWGDNADGKLGDGATTDRSAPFTLASPTSVAFIAGGDDHSVAVTTDGHVWTWGGNIYGQLGDGTTTGQVAPHDVLTLAGTWGATPPPVLSLAPGTYDAPQAVAVTAGAGVTVRFTTTGTVPTEADPVVASGAIVEIDRTLTLSVKAWSAGRAPSAPVVGTYQLQPPAPTASVPAGLYNAAQTVSLAGAAGVEIRYTLDGTDPSEASLLYASALTISQTATLRARAFKPNWTPSAALVAAYQIVVPVTSISLVSPTNGASLDPPATVDLQAAVTSNVPITVHFFEGATALGTVAEAPYRISWLAPGPGVYTLTATATDPFGTVTTASAVTLTVRTLPAISDVSPASGSAGTLVTIGGMNFGETQGTSSVWLGTKVGLIETWADGVITARIAAGASSGTVQVRLPDRSSNTMSITVLTPVISNATPGSGGVGTSVTIDGANFGSGQGTGQVWLGTAAGVVTSWSDVQILATIAAESQTGSVQVLPNGVASNSVPLTITGAAPRITGLSPTQGAAGTVVTLYGSGFGAGQGGGQARLGNSLASVSSWSDSQIQVSVPTGAISGVVKVQQGGLWSNAVMFRVPASAMGSASVMSPVALSLVVGENRTLQALDDDGELVTGGAWTSSDTDVVSLSTADPPVLTAVAPGTATISVGGASSEVTVYAGPSLPLGTPIWTNGASTAGGLYPAVPNYDAVADVFAVAANDEVTAITADGSTAWIRPGLSVREVYPDFQGGAVITEGPAGQYGQVLRLDPLTGEPLHLFSHSAYARSYASLEPRIHPDGTVFVTDYTCTSTDCSNGTDNETGAWVVGLDSKTGATKFRVRMQNSTDFTDTTPADEAFCQFTGGLITQHPWVDHPWAAIIAGDGFFYVPYRRYVSNGSVGRSAAQIYGDAAYDLWDQLVAHVVNSEFAAALAAHAALMAATGESTPWNTSLNSALNQGAAGRTEAISLLNLHNQKYRRLCDQSYTWTEQLRVMRVASDGTSTDMTVKSWESSFTSTYNLVPYGPLAPWGYRESVTHAGTESAVVYDPSLITDADQGVLLSWIADERCAGTYPPEVLVLTNTCVPANDHHLTRLTSGALSSDVVWGHGGSQAVRPLLQLEDGTFVGARRVSGTDTAVAFDGIGNVKWELSGFGAQMAVEGGGVLASNLVETLEFDAAGATIERIGKAPVYGWSERHYEAVADHLELIALKRVPMGGTAAPRDTSTATYGTFVSFMRTAVDTVLPQLKDYGGGCKLGTNMRPLLADVSTTAFEKYLTKRQQLLDFGGLTGDSGFSTFKCTTVIKPPYFGQLSDLVSSLVPIDGFLTTRSQFDAGFYPPGLHPLTLEGYKTEPVCAVFTDYNVRAGAQMVQEAGISGPPRNIYINNRVFMNGRPPVKIDSLRPGTILHEGLHSLTSKGDTDLAKYLAENQGTDVDAFVKRRWKEGSKVITEKLEQFYCAPLPWPGLP